MGMSLSRVGLHERWDLSSLAPSFQVPRVSGTTGNPTKKGHCCLSGGTESVEGKEARAREPLVCKKQQVETPRHQDGVNKPTPGKQGHKKKSSNYQLESNLWLYLVGCQEPRGISKQQISSFKRASGREFLLLALAYLSVPTQRSHWGCFTAHYVSVFICTWPPFAIFFFPFLSQAVRCRRQGGGWQAETEGSWGWTGTRGMDRQWCWKLGLFAPNQTSETEF